MNYELAKKLKDAGFPLKYAQSPHEIVHGCQFEDGSVAYFPTLSELIEACGEGFSVLIRCDKGWHAGVDGHPFSAMAEDKPQGCGSTPSEAIANLWLALNLPTTKE